MARAMLDFDLDAYVARTGAVELESIPWDEVPRHHLPAEAVRALTFMQDIESHTIIYLRSLLATRAIDDPEVATFLACWVYEETWHGIAIVRFLEAAGHPLPPRARPRGQEPMGKRLEAWATAAVSGLWRDFCAVHMTWGAINELTTLNGYRRLATLAKHPVLTQLLERLMRDESKHFFFYYRQADARLRRPGVARVARFLVDHFWAPVGSGVMPDGELRFLAGYLFADGDGLATARKIDETIRRLPGFETVALLEAWLNRHTTGGSHGNGRR